MTLIDQIRDLIAAGETEKSLKELYTYVKENNADVIDNLVMLQNRMQTMQRAVSLGTMDDRSAALERAKINEAILKLLPQLTPEYLSQANIRREPVYQAPPQAPQAAPAKNMNRLYLIGGGILLVLILIFALSRGGASENETTPAGETSAVAEPANTTAATAGPGLTAPEGSLLAKVMSEHAGYALWKSEYSSTNGQSIFRFESDKVCQEIKNDAVAGTFEVYENGADYVTIYSSAKKLYVRIGEHDAQFQSEGETEWGELFSSGAWITPPDAPQ